MPIETPLNLFDYEALAQPRMHPALWDYIVSGAGDEITVAENRRAFDRATIRPRVLVDVSRIDTATTVLGAPVAAPILIAPSGRHGAILPEGECATVGAAGQAGVAMVVSGLSTRSIEEVAAAASGPLAAAAISSIVRCEPPDAVITMPARPAATAVAHSPSGQSTAW